MEVARLQVRLEERGLIQDQSIECLGGGRRSFASVAGGTKVVSSGGVPLRSGMPVRSSQTVFVQVVEGVRDCKSFREDILLLQGSDFGHVAKMSAVIVVLRVTRLMGVLLLVVMMCVPLVS